MVRRAYERIGGSRMEDRAGKFGRRLWRGALLGLLCTVLLGCQGPELAPFLAKAPALDLPGTPRRTTPWPNALGPENARFAPLEALSPEAVGDLTLAWAVRTGDAGTVFQNTPILAQGRLLACSPHNQVLALDPLTGATLWRFDPKVGPGPYPNQANCRAVAAWETAPAETTACAARVLMATNDARLFALDLATGTPCADFGIGGEVDLADGIGDRLWPQEVQVTSAPAVVKDLVVVGSAISDNMRIDAPSGVVRAFDVRSGALRWAFDLAPPDYPPAPERRSKDGYLLGTPNVWAGFTVDADRGLIFLPTGNPAPDYFRDDGPDRSYYGSSVVALDGETGAVRWRFQLVHQDFWDFDTPAAPVLLTLRREGKAIPALAQNSKMGFVYLLHRETGEPLMPVEERPVPQGGPLAPYLSPTQPFPPEAYRFARPFDPARVPFGCGKLMDATVQGPIFSPITTEWTLGFPSHAGASNWGGLAADSERQTLAFHIQSVASRTKLIPRTTVAAALPKLASWDPAFDLEALDRGAYQPPPEAWAELKAALEVPPGAELAWQRGTSHFMAREFPMAPLPCAGGPFNEVLSFDLAEERPRFRQPHGQDPLSKRLPLELGMGMIGQGGPLLTAGGVLFLGASADERFRAYDAESGALLWEHALPYSGLATPMAYAVQRPSGDWQSFVVIAAGGDARLGAFGGGGGDFLVAFALPATQEN